MPPQLYVSILSTAPGLTHTHTHRFAHSLQEARLKQLLKGASPVFLAKLTFHRRLKLFPAQVYPCRLHWGLLPRPTCQLDYHMLSSQLPRSSPPPSVSRSTSLALANLPSVHLLNPPPWHRRFVFIPAVAPHHPPS